MDASVDQSARQAPLYDIVATWRLWLERYGAALDTAGLLAPHFVRYRLSGSQNLPP
jgi:hypothetical protein